MTPERTRELAEFYRQGLLEDTIPWWQNRFVDKEQGGFLTYFDADGSLLSTDKPVWLLARIIWVWSRLYNHVEQRQDWLDVAAHGLEFMRQYAFDEDGRMFYLLTRDGRPLRKRRYLFTETFGVIALAEYARAADSKDALDQARELFDLVLRCHETPGMLEPKTNPGTRQMIGLAMPMILTATTQILRDIDPRPKDDRLIDKQLDLVFGKLLQPGKRCLLESVLTDGSILDTPEGRTINPGHSIETAWFILSEARHRNDKKLAEDACQILRWSLEAGWDPEHGGLLYFVDCDGKPAEPYEHELKLWWPHTEALYACLLAGSMTGDAEWDEWYERIHNWAFSHFPDREHGEWYGYLRRDGALSSPVKGNHWKGPFHLPRAQLYCCKLLSDVIENSCRRGIES